MRSGRRRFLVRAGQMLAASGAAWAWPASGFAQGAGAPRLRLGFAGFGEQGGRLARLAAAVPSLQITAVADAYQGRLLRARELLGAEVATMRDGRALVDRADVDAVVIATPDHLHASLAVAAANAEKDVYCECPVAHSASDTEALAGRFGRGSRIFQGGGAGATSPLSKAARRFVADGRLGRITLVSGVWDSGSAVDAWIRPYPPDASPESIDFAAFTGRADEAIFDPAQFFRWPCYWRFGSGLAGARFAPMLSSVHAVLDLSTPSRVLAAGSLHRWKDGREVPDTLVAVLDYPEGVTVMLSATQNGTGRAREIRFVGTDATMTVGARRLTVVPEPAAEPYATVAETWARPYRDWFYMMHGMSTQGLVRGAPDVEKTAEHYVLPEGAATAAAHLADFAEAVRTRRAPTEPLGTALAVARATQLVTLAWQRGAAVHPGDLAGEGSAR